MSLYIGSDNNGKQILSLTKHSRTESQQKGQPLPDAYIDTRLPYLRVVKTIYMQYNKSVYKWDSSHYECRYKGAGIPQEVTSLLRKGRIIFAVRVRIADSTRADAGYNNKALAITTAGDPSRIQPNENGGGPWLRPTSASTFNFLPQRIDAKWVGSSANNRSGTSGLFVSGSMVVFQVTNMVVDPRTGKLTFEDIPTLDGIKIDNKNFTVGTFNYQHPTVLTTKVDKRLNNNIIRYNSSTNEFNQALGTQKFLTPILNMGNRFDKHKLIDIVEHIPVPPRTTLLERGNKNPYGWSTYA